MRSDLSDVCLGRAEDEVHGDHPLCRKMGIRHHAVNAIGIRAPTRAQPFWPVIESGY